MQESYFAKVTYPEAKRLAEYAAIHGDLTFVLEVAKRLVWISQISHLG